MGILSQRVTSMAESETLKMAKMARELREQGHAVISLSLGEPDFDTPDHIKKVATRAIEEGFTKYTPVSGILELKKAISNKFHKENNLPYAVNQIVVSNGAKQSFANICLAMLDEGDEVVVFSPYWVSYVQIIQMAGGKSVIVKAGIDQDYKVSAEQVEKAITDKTKFILFSSPCNPTGSVFTRHELDEIANVVAKFPHVYIVSDEIYEYIQFADKHESIGSNPLVFDRTITINGFSKGYAMTGWRLGYLGAPKFIAEACEKIQGQFTSGAASFSQKAAVEALEASNDPTDRMKDAFLVRRDLVIDLLNKIKGIKINHPNGAFYLFPDISWFFGKSNGKDTIHNADDFCDLVMNNVYVGLVSGGAFGAPECIRISYAASEQELREACLRLAEYLGNFK